MKSKKDLILYQVWYLLGGVVFGLFFGLVVRNQGVKNGDDGNLYFIVILIIAFVVSLINFLIKVIKICKRG